MSMYNMIFGSNPWMPVVLGLLNDNNRKFGRLRDAWIEKLPDEQLRLAVYTRNGGPNRKEHMPDFTNDPLYIEDRDDAFDNTYATIYFKLPEDAQERIKVMGAPDNFNLSVLSVPVVDTSARWKQMLIQRGDD